MSEFNPTPYKPTVTGIPTNPVTTTPSQPWTPPGKVNIRKDDKMRRFVVGLKRGFLALAEACDAYLAD